MNTKTSELFRALEDNKKNYIQYLTEKDPQLFVLKHSPHEWSVLQLIDHLIKVEVGSMKYLQKKLSFNPSLPQAGILDRLKDPIIKLVLNTPIKFKASPILQEESVELSYQELLNHWSSSRLEMGVYLDSLSHEILNAVIFRNFAVGRITSYQQLAFLDAHMKRHFKQLKHILRKNGI